ncbi:MAG: PilZ domain-containing protein, partial [Myxococcota bacterium]
MTPENNNVVMLRLTNHRAFLRLFFKEGVIGSIFVPGATQARPGDAIRLGVFFEEEQRTFRIRGTIRWKRMTKSKRLPVGMAVEVLPDDKEALQLILDFAHGREVSWTEREERVPAQIQIHYATGSVFLSDVTEDVSNGGMFLRTQHPLEIGETVRLK